MRQIALFEITGDPKYIAKRSINTKYWKKAKEIFSWTLKQHCHECKNRNLQWIEERMISGDFPDNRNDYCNGVTCVPNSGEHSKNQCCFTVFDIDGDSWIYEAENGDFCIAQIYGTGETKYYRIAILNY